MQTLNNRSEVATATPTSFGEILARESALIARCAASVAHASSLVSDSARERHDAP